MSKTECCCGVLEDADNADLWGYCSSCCLWFCPDCVDQGSIDLTSEMPDGWDWRWDADDGWRDKYDLEYNFLCWECWQEQEANQLNA